jgi:hypothetical protein
VPRAIHSTVIVLSKAMERENAMLIAVRAAGACTLDPKPAESRATFLAGADFNTNAINSGLQCHKIFIEVSHACHER